MKFEDLTKEQQEKAKACKTPEEIFALAKEVGYELSEDEIEAISGGEGWEDINPPGTRCRKHCSVF